MLFPNGKWPKSGSPVFHVCTFLRACVLADSLLALHLLCRLNILGSFMVDTRFVFLELGSLMPCAPVLFCVPAISRTIIGLSNDFALTWPIEVKVSRGSPIRWRVVKTPPIANQHFPRVHRCTAHHRPSMQLCPHWLKLHQGKHGMKMGANSQENINRNLTRIFRGQIDFKDFSYM